MSRVLASLSEITPAWCEETLRENGWLRRGRVRSLEVTEAETTLSLVANLELRYSTDAPGCAPRHLFLKLSKPAADLADCSREVDFYQEIAPLKPEMPVVRFHAAVRGGERCCMLLEDVSRSHTTLGDQAPQEGPAGLVIDALAELHAGWWNDPRLSDRLTESTRRRFLEYTAGSGARYGELLDAVGNLVTEDWRRIYESALEKGPELALARIDRGVGLTLCHHDCHENNFMIPRGGQPRTAAGGSAFIVDWPHFSRWWGAQDVVKFHYFTGRADLARQDALLRRYHARLLELGVRDYPWEEFFFDCRLSVFDLLLHVLDRYKNREILPDLAKAMKIYDGMGCARVFQTSSREGR